MYLHQLDAAARRSRAALDRKHRFGNDLQQWKATQEVAAHENIFNHRGVSDERDLDFNCDLLSVCQLYGRAREMSSLP